MATRGQILRSSITGNVPAAGGQAPGVMWTNFPDLQLGVIDATKTAQRLIAVRYFSTQANYATNDIVVQAGAIYIAKGAVSAGAFVPANWSKIAQVTDIPAVYILPTASMTVLGGVKIDGTTVKIDGGGVISSAGLVAVSTTPPVSPQNGSLWFDLVGGQLYAWVNDGTSSQWVIAVNQNLAGGVWLPLTGGILSGAISGPSATFDNLSAPQAIGDNRIINGDMRIDQRNGHVSGTANGYTVDRWQYFGSQTGKITWGGSFAGPAGFPYSLPFGSNSAYTALAADSFSIYQPVEADMVSDFAWGSASAQPVTLSFWARSSLTGTFGGALANGAGTRAYPFTYSIPAANTWTKIAVIIPGDTAGTWALSGNAAGLLVQFDLGSGATWRGTAGAWVNGNLSGATGAVSIVATNGAAFYLTGVKLEIGSVATPYNRQSLAKSMADCQRYYSVGATVISGYILAGGIIVGTCPLPATMRASPTIVPAHSAAANMTGTYAVGIPEPRGNSFYEYGTATATGAAQYQVNWTASAEL